MVITAQSHNTAQDEEEVKSKTYIIAVFLARRVKKVDQMVSNVENHSMERLVKSEPPPSNQRVKVEQVANKIFWDRWSTPDGRCAVRTYGLAPKDYTVEPADHIPKNLTMRYWRVFNIWRNKRKARYLVLAIVTYLWTVQKPWTTAFITKIINSISFALEMFDNSFPVSSRDVAMWYVSKFDFIPTPSPTKEYQS